MSRYKVADLVGAYSAMVDMDRTPKQRNQSLDDLLDMWSKAPELVRIGAVLRVLWRSL